ncbi:MAG: hypothetical protein C0467_28140 [Planctomycetaceae bacterium]|nr:hypothetical protein [Planctomycetaceae bacterium]
MAGSEASNAKNPTLQKPGAGLPWWELLVARHLVFPMACRKPWATAAQQFQDEGARVLAVLDSIPAERVSEPVLVPRIAGMEDSSRFWSAIMTVEHLNMVGSAVRRVISSLRQGQVPSVEPRVADFKPRGSITPAEVRSEFVRLLADAAEAEKVEPPIPRGVGPRYGHPWFGPMDAHQWHCLLGFHQGVHRKQIEAIRKGLGIA